MTGSNPQELTPYHCHILKMCIALKMYSLGFSIGNKKYTVFDPAVSGLAPIDVMSFYYYFGYICTALKKYDKAIEAFRFVLVQPTYVIHQCMISAYKKYIVVSLLSGKFPDFPKAGSETMRSYLPRLCSDYKELAEAMATVAQRYSFTYRKTPGSLRPASVNRRSNSLRIETTYGAVLCNK